MSADSRPLIVLASPINPDGHALLETEARVVVSAEPTTSRVVELAREAHGVLFRGGPRCDEAFLDGTSPVPLSTELLIGQQQIADTLHRRELIPRAIRVAEAQWQPRLAG